MKWFHCIQSQSQKINRSMRNNSICAIDGSHITSSIYVVLSRPVYVLCRLLFCIWFIEFWQSRYWNEKKMHILSTREITAKTRELNIIIMTSWCPKRTKSKSKRKRITNNHIYIWYVRIRCVCQTFFFIMLCSFLYFFNSALFDWVIKCCLWKLSMMTYVFGSVAIPKRGKEVYCMHFCFVFFFILAFVGIVFIFNSYYLIRVLYLNFWPFPKSTDRQQHGLYNQNIRRQSHSHFRIY